MADAAGTDAGVSTVPDHVPPDLVVDYDRFRDPARFPNPQLGIAELFRAYPPIFYTPRNGGHWMCARSTVALAMLRDWEIFSSNPALNAGLQRDPRTAPNQYDPPTHSAMRHILNRSFAPGTIMQMEPRIRAFAGQLIDDALPAGRVEFLSRIAKRFPIDIFLLQAGADLSDRETLVDLADGFTKSPKLEDRQAAVRALADHLVDYLRAREAEPKDDLLSVVVQGKMEGGRAVTEEEKQGLAVLLFLGGLDTVAATLSFIMLHLACNPQDYARLVEAPDRIGGAVEELMRVHGVAQMERAVSRDIVYEGVAFKKGDRVTFHPQIYGLDDPTLAHPEQIDFERERSPHMIFGSGPHRCIGSHLARFEIRVFLEEWVKRVPAFSLDGAWPEMAIGVVWSPKAVPLRWAPTSPA